MLFHYTIGLLVAWLVSDVFAVDLMPIDPTVIPEFQKSQSSKRAASFTGEFDLRSQEEFFWGAPAGEKLIYANLTVYFPETYENVIAMERFAPYLKSVNCAEDMMLEFKDDQTFEYAKDVWNWVNQDVNNSFIMVTNYEGCADNMERLPFVVSNIRYDEAANKAFLTADLKEWEDVVHSYTLHVGHMPLTPTHRMLMTRGVMPRLSQDVTLGLTSGFDQNLFSANVGGWTTSVDAVIRTVGSLNVDFDVDISWGGIKSASMSITPQDIAASLQLALTEKGTLKQAYPWKKTVVSIPIQGINAKVFKLGAFLDIDVGFTMEEWTGEAHASFGARAEISNSAIIKIDLKDKDNTAFSGWTPSFTSIPLTLSAKIAGAAEVYAEPNVKLEASALKYGANVALGMKMPYIQADFAAMYESTGVCNTKKTLGVDVDATIGIELNAQAATKGNEASPFWERELFKKEWPLFSECMAFGPNNAKEGEAVEPNSKPKTSKSKKSSKTSKTPAPTKKLTPTDEPKPTSKTPTPTPTPTPSLSKKSSKSNTNEPPKTSTSKTGKASGTDEPSGSKTSKATSTPDEPTGSTESTPSDKPTGSTKPTSGDDASFTRSSSIDTTRTSSSDMHTTFSTLSWSNSTRTHPPENTVEPSQPTEDSTSGTSSGDNGPTPTATPTGGESPPGSTRDGDPPATSGGGHPSESSSGIAPPAGTTSPPSTLSTVTLTSSSVSSTSTSDSCPITGCKNCGDIYDEDDLPMGSIEVEGPGLVNNLTRRYASRQYSYVCVTEKVVMARYPQFTDWQNPTKTVNVNEFYQGKDADDCLNHKITMITSPPSPIGNPGFAMEHIYEGIWIVNFLTYLTEKEKIDCDRMKKIFFDTDTGSQSSGKKWIEDIMASLGSDVNEKDLVFLRGNINGAKNRVFDESTKVIADKKWKDASSTDKLRSMAVFGRALDYMHHDKIARRMKETAEKIEAALDALVEAAKSNGKLKEALGDDWVKEGVLANKHREWLSKSLKLQNDDATISMAGLASEALDLFDPTTRGQVRTTSTFTDPTKRFLASLSATPPPGFEASKWL